MKKLLIVLLLLAVAGGLFAQTTVTWAGRLDTRLRARLGYGGEGNDDWGLSWSTFGTRLNATIRNNDQGWGGYLSFRPNLDGLGSNANMTSNLFHSYNGFVNILDGKVKLVGGKWGSATETEFSEGWWWVNSLWSSTSSVNKYNIGAFLYPMDGLRLGLGVTTRDDASALFNRAALWFGARYDATDELSFRTQFNYGETDGINAMFDVFFDSDDLGLTVILNNNFNRLDDFEMYSTGGNITLNQFFEYRAVENLTVDVAVTEIIYGRKQTGANGSTEGDPYYNPRFDIEVDVLYNTSSLTSSLSRYSLVGLVVNYWTAGGIRANSGDYVNSSSSVNYLLLQPFVRIGQSSSRFVGLGYQTTIQLDLEEKNVQNDIILRFYWNF